MAAIEDRGPQLLVVCIVLLTVSIVSLALRVWTRLFIVRAFDRDDYLMVAAAVSATSMPSMLYVKTQLTRASLQRSHSRSLHFVRSQASTMEQGDMPWT